MTTLFYRYLHTLSSSPPSKSSIITYLTQTLDFPKPRAVFFVNRFSSTQTNPQSVILFLKSHGFNLTDIHKWVTQSPQILFSDVDKTLKSRIQFFQDLGLTGSDLGKFISKNPVYLSNRFEERLKPCVDIVKRLMLDDHNNENLIRTLRRCNWVDIKQPVVRVSANVKYLEQCGIVGAQLATVITRQPRLLIMSESDLKELVSKVLDMGFSIDNRMLVHAIYTVSCLSDKTFERKLDLFRSYGFTKDEFLSMFKKAPGLLRVSEAKLKTGIGFFVNTVKFDREVLVRRPSCLMLSLEERVIPRFKILDIMMSKRILKKMPKFLNVMWLPEDEFLEKFISKDRNHAEELLLAYRSGDLLLQRE
ncbi:putative transcription regulator mTERF family [Helianthus annuus]|nr:putative transcription regulator mTERF family [Helianthus annuus]KAJ0937767.1 putative transcription regulator mTERF family [Helianthus annuus]